MKNSKVSTIIALTAMALLMLTLGCQESSQIEIKQARLTVQENLELKEQIESLKQEIQEQKKLLEESEKEKLDIAQQSGDSAIKLMKILVETGKELEQAVSENIQLKDRIKQLEAKLAEDAAN